MGVPQGSILSVTLFIIKINSIVNCMGPGADCSLFVDDFCISYRSKSMHTVERQLQHHLNRLQNWAVENGFKFSTNKTVCTHFCQRRGIHPDPELDQELIFDKKFTFIPHINDLKRDALLPLI